MSTILARVFSARFKEEKSRIIYSFIIALLRAHDQIRVNLWWLSKMFMFRRHIYLDAVCAWCDSLLLCINLFIYRPHWMCSASEGILCWVSLDIIICITYMSRLCVHVCAEEKERRRHSHMKYLWTLFVCVHMYVCIHYTHT